MVHSESELHPSEQGFVFQMFFQLLSNDLFNFKNVFNDMVSDTLIGAKFSVAFSLATTDNRDSLA